MPAWKTRVSPNTVRALLPVFRPHLFSVKYSFKFSSHAPVKEQCRQHGGRSHSSMSWCWPVPGSLSITATHTRSFVSPKSRDDAACSQLWQSKRGTITVRDVRAGGGLRPQPRKSPFYLVKMDVPSSAHCCGQHRRCLCCCVPIRWMLTLLYLQPAPGSSGKRYSEQFNNEWHHLNTLCFVANDEIHGKTPTPLYFNFKKKKPKQKTNKPKPWSCGNSCLLMTKT